MPEAVPMRDLITKLTDALEDALERFHIDRGHQATKWEHQARLERHKRLVGESRSFLAGIEPIKEPPRGPWPERLAAGLRVTFEGGVTEWKDWPIREQQEVIDYAVAFITELVYDERDDPREVLALKLRLAEAQRMHAEHLAREANAKLHRLKALADTLFPPKT